MPAFSRTRVHRRENQQDVGFPRGVAQPTVEISGVPKCMPGLFKLMEIHAGLPRSRSPSPVC